MVQMVRMFSDPTVYINWVRRTTAYIIFIMQLNTYLIFILVLDLEAIGLGFSATHLEAFKFYL